MHACVCVLCIFYYFAWKEGVILLQCGPSLSLNDIYVCKIVIIYIYICVCVCVLQKYSLWAVVHAEVTGVFQDICALSLTGQFGGFNTFVRIWKIMFGINF